MNSRLLIPLVAMVALAALIAWALMLPSPPRPQRPQKPDRVAATAPDAPYPTNAEPEPVPPPQARRLPGPPPAPAAVNDPAKGVVTLRVIDAATNRPLTRTICDLAEMVSTLDESGVPQDTRVEGRLVRPPPPAPQPSPEDSSVAETDADGLITLRAAHGREWVGSFRRVWFRGPHLHWKYPIPVSWQPESDEGLIARQIAALRHGPLNGPIDVFVQRADSTVYGVVRDAEGNPIGSAEVFAFPLETTPRLAPWAAGSSPEFAELRKAKDRAAALQERIEKIGTMLANPDLGANRLAGDNFRDRMRFGWNALTARDGRYSIPGLFHGLWMFYAWTPCHAPVFLQCSLNRPRHALDFELADTGLGTLRVIVEVMDGEHSVRRLGVSLYRSRPAGIPPGNEDTRAVSETHFRPPRREAVFEGLKPGYYRAQVFADHEDENYRWNSALANIPVRGAVTLTIPVGNRAMAAWKPTLLADGKPVQGWQASILGGPYGDLHDLGLQAGEDGVAEVMLPAGEYTVWISGLAPRTFTLTPGQTRHDQFTLPLLTATFEIAPGLAGLLGPSIVGPNEGRCVLTINLQHDGIDYHDLLGFANAPDSHRLRGIAPGKPVTLRLFAGVYRWRLEGSEMSLGGPLNIVAGDTNRFAFSLDSLPGLARLDIDLTAYARAGRATPTPQLKALDVEPGRLSRFPSRGTAGPTIVYPPEDWLTQVELAPGRYAAFAARGFYELDVDGRKRAVTVPGRVALAPHESPAMVEVSWNAPAVEGTTYEVEIVDSSGRTVGLDAGTIVLMPAGSAGVRATKSVGGEKPAYFGGTLDVALAGKAITVEVASLPWRAYGSFTLTCEGCGAPGEKVDTWWADNGAAKYIRILVLDQADFMGPAEVELIEVDEWLPQCRTEFVFRNRFVPPGRYKVIPWPDAPEKYCRTFEVSSGKHVEVRVKGL